MNAVTTKPIHHLYRNHIKHVPHAWPICSMFTGLWVTSGGESDSTCSMSVTVPTIVMATRPYADFDEFDGNGGRVLNYNTSINNTANTIYPQCFHIYWLGVTTCISLVNFSSLWQSQRFSDSNIWEIQHNPWRASEKEERLQTDTLSWKQYYLHIALPALPLYTYQPQHMYICNA